MKVGRIYIIGFDGSKDKEVHDGISALKLKYAEKGVPKENIISAFICQQTVYYQTLKDKGGLQQKTLDNATIVAKKGGLEKYNKGIGKDDFNILTGLGELSQTVDGGVGVYFIFHGTPGNADIATNVLVYIVSELMGLHPEGGLRKVVFVTCGFANNDIQNGLSRAKTTDLLQKFANALHAKNFQTKSYLPKLAGYLDGVFMNDSGRKFGDNKFENGIKGEAGKKVAFLLDRDGKYYRSVLNASRDGWADPTI